MSDLTSSKAKIQNEEVTNEAAVSQSTQTKIGSSINYLIDTTDTNTTNISTNSTNISSNDTDISIIEGVLKRDFNGQGTSSVISTGTLSQSVVPYTTEEFDTSTTWSGQVASLTIGHYYSVRFELESWDHPFASVDLKTLFRIYSADQKISGGAADGLSGPGLSTHYISLPRSGEAIVNEFDGTGDEAIVVPTYIFQANVTGNYTFDALFFSGASSSNGTVEFNLQVSEVYTNLWT